MKYASIKTIAGFGVVTSLLSTTPPAAAQATSVTMEEKCTPIDLKKLRNDLRSVIVEIDQKLIYVQVKASNYEIGVGPVSAAQNDAAFATQEIKKVLDAQAKIGETAVKTYDAWAAAYTEFNAKSEVATAERKYLADLETVARNVRPEVRAGAEKLGKEQRTKVGTADAARDTALVAVCRTERILRAHHEVATKLAIPPVDRPSDLPANLEADRKAIRKAITQADCIEGIENPRTNANFATCLISPYSDARAPGPMIANTEATSVPIPNRPLRPRGFTASFEGSKSDSEVTLQFANEYKRRSPSELGQRYFTWGFSAGVALDTGALIDLDRDGSRNTADFKNGFDRIGAKSRFIGSLSLHDYGWESAPRFNKRAQKIADEVYAACVKDRASSNSIVSCVGGDLRQWLLKRDEKDVQTNKKYANQYSDLYFGSAEGVINARRGLILSGGLARPKLTYQLPNNLGTLGEKTDERYWDFSLGIAGYYRWDLTDASDLIGVLSLTYKNDWRDYFASDEKLDKTKLPVLDKGFAPAVEVRYLWRGGEWFPATALLPKFTLDLAADSKSIEVPLLFLFGENMGSSAGIKYTHTWHDTYDDGVERPNTSEISLVFQKVFSFNPK